MTVVDPRTVLETGARRSLAVRLARDRDDWLVTGLVVAYGLFFALAIIVPLGITVSRSLRDASGQFIGLANYAAYFGSPALLRSIGNSVFVAASTTMIVVVLAFTFAYALTRTSMPFKTFFKIMAIVPLLTPGLLKAIALVYWFGNQGVLKGALFGNSIYGPVGIIMASVLWTFPHAVIILMTALLLADARLYETAEIMRTSRLRTFCVVTLPGARYGLISATILVFVLVLTDFGIPKVIGGNFNVLATDIYKEVIGQQNFEMGAVVSVVLLVPAVLAFVIDRIVTNRQVAQLSARAVPLVPKRAPMVDRAMLAFCSLVSLFALGTVLMGQFAALVKFWPYNLSLTLSHYVFDMEGVGWENFFNSLLLASVVACAGTVTCFLGAYVVEKSRRDVALRRAIHVCALLPMAIPGLVLGLGYLLFINRPDNPLGLLYGTLAILAVNTIAHYYPVAHLTALTALKQMDREFEAVAMSLKASMPTSFRALTVPVCAPAILDIWIYLFLNAMTTVSGVIFLYGSQTKLASIAVVHMDEAGRLASAAAMAMLIVYACVAVRLLHVFVTTRLLQRLQRWRGA
ncbi:MAG: putative 2-aminoethylphosphonate ABC transporter permease subunit [Alphaproteobacteria bacterium]|nr:putative 2-aminoethylphosphonate ABC transporter permease subunit [Alphaproteobacteria bacterium]